MGSLPPRFSEEDFFCTLAGHRTEGRLTKFGLGTNRSIKGGLTVQMALAGSFSFLKAQRLTHRSEYERVRREGTTQRGKLLMLNVASVDNLDPSRAGFVTSRRIGGAVVRNRVRRRLREMVRKHQHELREGFWFVLVAKNEAVSASYHSLEDEWLRLARRASILL